MDVISLFEPFEVASSFGNAESSGVQMNGLRRRWTIFFRLMIGYLTIFILVMAVSMYAILRLHQLNTGMYDIVSINNLMMNYGEKLSDSIFSQLRNEKKYFITKDVTFYEQFLSASKEFDNRLAEVLLKADTAPQKKALEKIKTDHERYHALVDEEIKHAKANRNYSRKGYEREREKAVDGILERLKKLETYSRENLWNKLTLLEKARISARRFSIIISIGAIVMIVAVSFLITGSITKPLAVFMEKTREISGGVFKGDLNIASPPEISELATAFNSMCKRLQQLDKLKSDFFSSMSHELRTPLTSIKEGISLLQSNVGGPISDKQKRLLVILTIETNRLIDLVNSVLDLSKMEAGMMSYRFEQGSLVSLIDQVTMEIVPLVEAKKIKIETKMGEKLPAIRMDSERILQVLRNLIGNAVKFTPDGGQVKISVRSTNQGLEVSVADTGPGIPRDHLAAVFDKFLSSNQSKGTGLGLAIVKHIVTAHGGKVWAENKPEHGSTFIFLLPS
jgi:two-component system, NtrC family, sensor histidine kinase GlrK